MAALQRTLVKSQPELWHLIEQTERIEGWSSALLGRAAAVKVTEHGPGTLLAWEASAAEEIASIEIALSEKGWGTNVVISAEREGTAPAEIEGWIDAVLDELAEPERRPFRGI